MTVGMMLDRGDLQLIMDFEQFSISVILNICW